MITAGAGIIAYTLTILNSYLNILSIFRAWCPTLDAMAALAQKNYGTETATIMVLGMLINIAVPGASNAIKVHLFDRTSYVFIWLRCWRLSCL
ncbi:hypothetical protein MJ699_15895 [Klebsiella pneumoniae]|nr:hypothetical protein MJ699_15895 [Klebsiella pneumoniae]